MLQLWMEHCGPVQVHFQVDGNQDWVSCVRYHTQIITFLPRLSSRFITLSRLSLYSLPDYHFLSWFSLFLHQIIIILLQFPPDYNYTFLDYNYAHHSWIVLTIIVICIIIPIINKVTRFSNNSSLEQSGFSLS